MADLTGDLNGLSAALAEQQLEMRRDANAKRESPVPKDATRERDSLEGNANPGLRPSRLQPAVPKLRGVPGAGAGAVDGLSAAGNSDVLSENHEGNTNPPSSRGAASAR